MIAILAVRCSIPPLHNCLESSHCISSRSDVPKRKDLATLEKKKKYTNK